MRYWVYDEVGLFRKFWTKEEAKRFLQTGWKLVIIPKPKKYKVELDGLEEAPF